ncbi:AraC family transcriptional regulator [Sphingorhabdus sp. SMR4y]|uniref:AraC family transcriptional regulator n=1 Tax=Sphingorhabdus sp. SMR4y TaxID=2584094 RepID=UPI000B5CFEDE|nr:AraC family transcriptional regulator [Sphingorhabdus sp. SMR4y]ASK89521.1 putative HTH-type transcriptional regulator [Sphingorhabdus sp. SMR4y]
MEYPASKGLLIAAPFLYRAYLGCHALHARKPQLLAALDCSEAELRDPGYQLDDDAITSLCAAAREELNCTDIHSEIASKMVPRGFSDHGFSAFFQPSFGDALLHLIAKQRLGAEEPVVKILPLSSGDRLVWKQEEAASPDLVHIIFSLVHQCGELLADGRFKTVKAAHFAHRRPDAFRGFPSENSNSAPIPCHFNRPSTYLEYHPMVMAKPNQRHIPEIVSAVQRQEAFFARTRFERQNLVKLTYEYLLYLLDKSGLSLDAAAMTFGMAERTLRRKLVAEGMSYRQLLEQVRRETCRLYFLEGSRNLSEISAKLGYSELSAFTRAYTSWYGHPPSQDAGSNAIALAA